MADWIKVEVSTSQKIEVFLIAEILDLDADSVIGKLLKLWCWADANTIDGHARSVTKKILDRVVSCDGFANALLDDRVNWLKEMPNGELFFPNFDRHNGSGAKKRALGAARKAKQRDNEEEEKMSRTQRDKSVTREEKRREEIKETDPPVVPRVKKATQMPKGFAPSDKHQQLAVDLGTDLNSEFLAFTDFHVSKGSVFKDWDAALNTWLRNARKFGQRNTNVGRSTGVVTSTGDYNSIPDGFRGS